MLKICSNIYGISKIEYILKKMYKDWLKFDILWAKFNQNLSKDWTKFRQNLIKILTEFEQNLIKIEKKIAQNLNKISSKFENSFDQSL